LEAARQKISVIFALTFAMHVQQNAFNMKQNIVKNVPKYANNVHKIAGRWLSFSLENARIIYLHSYHNLKNNDGKSSTPFSSSHK
jgi:hypothetical protein